MRASQYLSQCDFHRQCNPGLCSPWGYTHDVSPEVNSKRLLIVGLNANDSDLEIGDPTRKEYSDYLKGLIRDEILIRKYKCLSNLIPPIARFLHGADYDDVKSQISILAHINWCNLISCCPPPTPRGKPTKEMKKYCTDRICQDGGPLHELIIRVQHVKPTHILVVGKDAQKIWKKCNSAGSKLNDILAKGNPNPSICFSKHPSQTSIKRKDYWREVYEALTAGIVRNG